jgi:hypothetical protein
MLNIRKRNKKTRITIRLVRSTFESHSMAHNFFEFLLLFHF